MSQERRPKAGELRLVATVAVGALVVLAACDKGRRGPGSPAPTPAKGLGALATEPMGTEPAGDVASARILEDATFRDQEGRPLRVSAAATGALVVNFVFTRCPTVCPLQTGQLVQVQRALPEGFRAHVRFLSVSVDPGHDTPSILKEFATARGVDLGNWSFAVASTADTARVIDRLGVFDPLRKRTAPGDHTTSVYLFDRGGRLMQRYAGAPLDSSRLVREIQQLATLGPTLARQSQFQPPPP